MGAVPARALAQSTWSPPDVHGVRGYSSIRPWRPVTHLVESVHHALGQIGMTSASGDGEADFITEKSNLRKALREKRRQFVKSLPVDQHAICFSAPPSPLRDMLLTSGVIGGYWPNAWPNAWEADPRAILRWAADQGRAIALPFFASRDSAMMFRQWEAENPLETGPFGILQPSAAAPALTPDCLLIPLIGFTRSGVRLGQGGGHYDRYCAAHPDALRIGLAWGVQCCDALPQDDHDVPLHAILTEREWIRP
jgi:5-formyltetrahydrofolate cyclo-ligase